MDISLPRVAVQVHPGGHAPCWFEIGGGSFLVIYFKETRFGGFLLVTRNDSAMVKGYAGTPDTPLVSWLRWQLPRSKDASGCVGRTPDAVYVGLRATAEHRGDCCG